MGIPEPVRGEAWFIISKANLVDPIEAKPGIRSKYMQTLLS